jgi:hypothetical protein
VDLGDLLLLVEKCPTQGLGVSQLGAIKIQCSMRLLQNQMKAEHMCFFGKVLGVPSDYYVAFSTVIDAWLPSIRYCSQNCLVCFLLMETPTKGGDEVTELGVPFTGNLISEFTLRLVRIIPDGQRLSAVLSDMAEQCVLIPTLSAVLKNPTWVGSPI